jgi:hypothetical protein
VKRFTKWKPNEEIVKWALVINITKAYWVDLESKESVDEHTVATELP